MAERKAFPLRIDSTVHAAIEKWAADEMRSTNAQIEYLLRDALRRAGRLKISAPSETSVVQTAPAQTAPAEEE